MNCEKLSTSCEPGYCWCGPARQQFLRLTDTGLRTLARERGLVVLTAEQAKHVALALDYGSEFAWRADAQYAGETIDAAISELEGGK